MNEKHSIRIYRALNRIAAGKYFHFIYLLSRINPFLFINYHKFRSLHNAYKGERCFIMGNGPSLNDTPLEYLETEYVWGLNRCYLLYNKIPWRPNFYTAVDDRVVPDISKELKHVMDTSPDTLFFLPEICLFSGMFNNRNNTIWFRQRSVNTNMGSAGYFSTNPIDFVRIPNTVTITALQLSAYMGFNPIVLIGCDTNFVLPGDIKSSGSVTDPGTGEDIEGYNITSLEDNDPNHFDSTYFGKGRKWHAPNVAGMINGYQHVKAHCDTRGIRILNATVGGQLEVFPRVDYSTLLKE